MALGGHGVDDTVGSTWTVPEADARPELPKAARNDVQLGKVELADSISANRVIVEGTMAAVEEFVGPLDNGGSGATSQCRNQGTCR